MARSILHFANFQNVKYYGATGDGETDDTAAITSAIAAIPSTGGVLYFPPGTYVTTGGFTLAYPTTVMGCGAGNILGDGAVTTITCTSDTAVLFTVNSRRAMFRDVALKCTHATPTAGAGIVVTSAYIHQKVDYESVSVYGFYIDIDVQVGAQWSMHNCFIIHPVTYGLKIANTVNGDAGDWSISNSNFNTGGRDAWAAIYIASSGGGKIVNTKINRNPPGTGKYFSYGVQLVPVSNTIDLLISNSSFENCVNAAVYANITTNWWHNIIITGNQFSNRVENQRAVIANAGTLGNLKGVIITGNVLECLDNNPNAAILLTKATECYVGGNVIRGYASELEEVDCSLLWVPTVTDVTA
jgi:hypothetical protein